MHQRCVEVDNAISQDRPLLATGMLIVIFVAVVGLTWVESGPAWAQGLIPWSTQPTATAVRQVVDPSRDANYTGPVPITWRSTPLLGDAPGERYLGRIVVELGGGVVFMPSQNYALIRRAIAALEARDSFPLVEFLEPGEPLLSPPFKERGTYRGGVVVELWDTTANVAIAAHTTTAKVVVDEATASLRSFR